MRGRAARCPTAPNADVAGGVASLAAHPNHQEPQLRSSSTRLTPATGQVRAAQRTGEGRAGAPWPTSRRPRCLGHRGFLGSTAGPKIREILRTHTGGITEGLAVQDLALIPALICGGTSPRPGAQGRAVPVLLDEQDARDRHAKPAGDGPDPPALAGQAGRHPLGRRASGARHRRARYFGGSLLLLGKKPTSALSIKETESVADI